MRIPRHHLQQTATWFSLHRELKLSVVAELSTVDTLGAATSLPAQQFWIRRQGSHRGGYEGGSDLRSKQPFG